MPPPEDWCDPLPDAEAMRATDRWAIDDRGVPSLDLMERAGAGVASAVEDLAPDGPVAVVCGKGNNGGDGLVAARLLRQTGRPVTVLIAGGSPAELRGDARENLLRLPGDQPLELRADTGGAVAAEGGADPGAIAPNDASGLLAGSAAIVDALLGTGFAGEPRGAVAAAIELIEAARAPVVSVDVPSGVDASTGAVAGGAVRATVTVTFHAAKPGLWIRPGKAQAGAVRVIDIGIPRGAPMAATIGLIGPAVLRSLPRRGAGSTKFSSGHVLVVGGSRGLTGAPLMAARAAMRAGAGYVTACVPDSQQPILAAGGTPELMTRPLPERDGALATAAVGPVLDAAGRGGALVLGPGLGRAEGALAFARELAAAAPVALVLDADGLNAHAGRPQDLARRTAPTILTPHAGELGRLLSLESEEIEHERLRHARAAAARSGAVVVLKGDDTLVADPDGTVAVSPGGSPALATAGTGDVLSGVLGALLAQGLPAFTAACAGVWLHAAAGRIAAERPGAVAESVIASDVIAALPAARAGAGAGAADGERGMGASQGGGA
ncbi:MAG TPA: NAD(P)H-hydrate dehydratase [Solirubrobacteraceae bacterium]|nr:NAD(P)H-hydrate dehydratase [Solirubrobacteraceae bacterium]